MRKILQGLFADRCRHDAEHLSLPGRQMYRPRAYLRKILQGLWFVFALSAVGISIRQGVLSMTWKIDNYGITWFIILLFVVGMMLSIFHYLGAKWTDLEHIRHIANDQAFWGVWGTIAGVFIAMLSLESATSDEVLEAIPGILIAFWTSIVGMAGAWLTMKTYQFLGGKNNE